MSGKKHDHTEEPAPQPQPAPSPGAGPEAPPQDQQPQADQAPDLQAERDDLLARLQRLSADFLNYKKRTQRETADFRQFATAELIRSLLPVLDDMERALAAWRADPANGQALADGMQLVQGKMLETLAGEGLAPIENPVGKCFDPQVHAAICQQPSAQHPEHTVLEEARKGYQLHGRTIRPADVVVSRKPDEQAPPPSEQDG